MADSPWVLQGSKLSSKVRMRTEVVPALQKRFMKHFEGTWTNNAITCWINYHETEVALDITIKHHGNKLVSVRIPLPNVDEVEKYLDQLGERIAALHKTYAHAFSDCLSDVDGIKYTDVNFNFADHKLGVCAYPNLGYIRWAWIRFDSPDVHPMWLKLFFNKYEVIMDKTMDSVYQLRKDQPDNPSGVPPSVRAIDPSCEDAARRYLELNHSVLFEQAKALPFNRCKLKEHMDWDQILLMRKSQDGKSLIMVTADEVTEDKYELWMAAFAGEPNKAGLAVRAGSHEQPLRLSGISRDFIHEAMPIMDLKAYDNNTKHFGVLYGSWHSNRFGWAVIKGKVHKEDEYASILMQNLVDKHLLKKK